MWLFRLVISYWQDSRKGCGFVSQPCAWEFPLTARPKNKKTPNPLSAAVTIAVYVISSISVELHMALEMFSLSNYYSSGSQQEIVDTQLQSRMWSGLYSDHYSKSSR